MNQTRGALTQFHFAIAHGAMAMVSWSLVEVALSSFARADEVEQVCGSANSTAFSDANSASPRPSTQRQYCDSARSAQDSADTNSALWKVWAGVATVCGAACAAPTAQSVCTGANVAGGVTDAAMTRNFNNGLTAILTSSAQSASSLRSSADAPTAVASGAPGVAPTAVPTGRRDRDYSACLTAATAVGQSVVKHHNMSTSEDSVRNSLASARKGNEGEGTAIDGASQNALAASADSSGSLNRNSDSSREGSSPEVARRQACREARSNPSVGSTMGCAIASDRNLPSFVTSPRFAQEFQKTTGTTLGDYFAKNEPPAQSIPNSMRSSLSPGQVASLAALTQDYAQRMANEDSSGSSYSSGGSGSAQAGGGGDDLNIGEMVAGLMDQMMPKNPEQATKSGLSAVIFANQNRSPASVAEDAKLSIFDRITYRYYFVGRRVLTPSGGTR